MQLLTTSQTAQIRLTVAAAYEALQIVEDSVCTALDRTLVVLSSERALAGYRLLWYVTKNIAEISWMVLVLGFTVCRVWLDRYVDRCLQTSEVCETSEVSDPIPDPWELPTESTPVAPASVRANSHSPLLLPPARESEIPNGIRELRKLCKDRGFTGTARWTKAQCLEALNQPVPTPRKRRRNAA